MKYTLLIAILMISGCVTDKVPGQRMVRVVETGASASGDTLSADAEGGAHGCRVETTEKPIKGDLTMDYKGNKCSVIYKRPADLTRTNMETGIGNGR